MSYPINPQGSSPPQPNQKLLTPALLTALGTLLALAIVTVVVLVTKDDPATTASGSGTTATSSTTSGPETTTAPPETTTATPTTTTPTSTTAAPNTTEETTDGSYSFTAPAGYVDGLDRVSVEGAIMAIYKESEINDGDFGTNVVGTATPNTGGIDLDTIVEEGMSGLAQQHNTTAELAAEQFGPIDGEESRTIAIGDYDKNGNTLQSTIVAVLHNDSIYLWTVNAEPSKIDVANADLFEFLSTITWL